MILVPSGAASARNVTMVDPGADHWTARVNFGDGGGWEQISYGEFDGRGRKRLLVKIIGGYGERRRLFVDAGT